MSNCKICPVLGAFKITDDLGLLALRIFFGGSLFALHGLDKLANFSAYAAQFPDPVGLGAKTSLVLAICAEVGAALLIVAGAFTRLAAFIAGFTMLVALVSVHHFVLKGANSGELAFLYLAAFIGLAIAGGGSYSVDDLLSKRAPSESF